MHGITRDLVGLQKNFNDKIMPGVALTTTLMIRLCLVFHDQQL